MSTEVVNPKRVLLQIDYETLRKLLEDGEAGVNLTNAIIQRCAATHIKSVINHDLMQKAMADINVMVKEAVAEHTGMTARGAHHAVGTLNQEIKEKITKQVKTRVGEVIEKSIAESIAKAINAIDIDKIAARVEAKVEGEILERCTFAIESGMRGTRHRIAKEML